MIEVDFLHQTPSSRLSLNAKLKMISSSELIKYESKDDVTRLCAACPTFGKKWSCPPHSPSLSDFDLSAYPRATLVLFWCNLDQFRYAKTEYIKIKAADSVLKSRMDRFMRNMESTLDGIMLSNGTCKLCRPCSGSVGKPCKRPEKMRFSMEALGLDVSRIMAEVFDHPLLWYSKGQSPAYLSAATCLLMKAEIDDAALKELVEDFL